MTHTRCVSYVSVRGIRHTITDLHFTNSDLVVHTTPSDVEVHVTVFQVPNTAFFIENRTCLNPFVEEVFPSAGSGCASIEDYYAQEYASAYPSPHPNPSTPIGPGPAPPSLILSTQTLIAILDRTLQALNHLISLEREEYSHDFEDPAEREAFLATFLQDETRMQEAVHAWHASLVENETARLRHRAAKIIQRAYREASGNPQHPMCRRRLQREFTQFP